MATITTAALIKRINRRLAESDQRLRVTRGEQMRLDVGDYWVEDLKRGMVLRKFVDPVELAEELECIYRGERVAD